MRAEWRRFRRGGVPTFPRFSTDDSALGHSPMQWLDSLNPQVPGSSPGGRTHKAKTKFPPSRCNIHRHRDMTETWELHRTPPPSTSGAPPSTLARKRPAPSPGRPSSRFPFQIPLPSHTGNYRAGPCTKGIFHRCASQDVPSADGRSSPTCRDHC